jgi:hypothetical protein
MTVTLHGDYVAKGVGLAESDTGAIVIDTIPEDAELVGGVFYWAFEDWYQRAAHRWMKLNGSLLLDGELIGEVDHWGHHTFVYRAVLSREELLDGTYQPVGGPLPPAPSGNGTYVLSGYPNEEPTVAHGATLVLVYEHESLPARDVAFNDGNVYPPTPPPPPFVHEARARVSGFLVGEPAGGRCTFIVGAGNANGRDQLAYETEHGRLRTGLGFPFDGSEGPHWDTESLTLRGMLQTGESEGSAIVRIIATQMPNGLFALDDLIWAAHVVSVSTANPVHPDPASLFY